MCPNKKGVSDEMLFVGNEITSFSLYNNNCDGGDFQAL